MEALPVVDLLDEATNGLARRADVAVVTPVDFLLLEGLHKALRLGVVVGVADPAHARLDAVCREFGGVVAAGILLEFNRSSQQQCAPIS